LLIGLPVALVLAWAFDVTATGIKATPRALCRQWGGEHPSSAQHLFPRWHFVKETVQLQTDLDPL